MFDITTIVLLVLALLNFSAAIYLIRRDDVGGFPFAICLFSAFCCAIVALL